MDYLNSGNVLMYLMNVVEWNLEFSQSIKHEYIAID
jgi:hypothetical protein